VSTVAIYIKILHKLLLGIFVPSISYNKTSDNKKLDIVSGCLNKKAVITCGIYFTSLVEAKGTIWYT
jgi:hypothetical protein